MVAFLLLLRIFPLSEGRTFPPREARVQAHSKTHLKPLNILE